MPADSNSVLSLIKAIALKLGENEDPCVIEVMQRLGQQDLSSGQFKTNTPNKLPVLRELDKALDQASKFDMPIAVAINKVRSELNWKQSNSYTDDIVGKGFIDNYGWCLIIGPDGFFRGDDFLLGLLMLGPDQHYRDHFHPAPELYWPLTGGTDWRQGHDGFATKNAGAIIWHEPFVPHATKTQTQPLLTVWSWTRDTATAAKLCNS